MNLLKKLIKWIEDGPGICEMASSPVFISPKKVDLGEMARWQSVTITIEHGVTMADSGYRKT